MACVCRTTIRAARNGSELRELRLSIAQWTAKCRCTLFRFRCSLPRLISSPSWKRCNAQQCPLSSAARERQSPDCPPRLPPYRWSLTISQICHPDRSGPISPRAELWRVGPRSGGIPLPPRLSFAFLLSPGRWSLTTLPNSVIRPERPDFSFAPNYGASGAEWRDPSSSPASLAFLLVSWSLVADHSPKFCHPTGAGRFLPSRRTMARRAAEWRDPSSSPPLFAFLLPPGRWSLTTLQILSSRPERPDFFLRAELWRVGPRSGGSSGPYRADIHGQPEPRRVRHKSPQTDTLPNSVIPTGAARFLPSRRTMARRPRSGGTLCRLGTGKVPSQFGTEVLATE